MRKLSKHAILLPFSLLIFTMFIGCSNKQNSKNSFDIEEFENQMKAKKYKFELKEIEKDFLPATRKITLIDKEVIETLSVINFFTDILIKVIIYVSFLRKLWDIISLAVLNVVSCIK